jgi:hypothetical protein
MQRTNLGRHVRAGGEAGGEPYPIGWGEVGRRPSYARLRSNA